MSPKSSPHCGRAEVEKEEKNEKKKDKEKKEKKAQPKDSMSALSPYTRTFAL